MLYEVITRLGSFLFGSRVSDVYVQPHIGGDLALLAGVVKLVLEQNSYNFV